MSYLRLLAVPEGDGALVDGNALDVDLGTDVVRALLLVLDLRFDNEKTHRGLATDYNETGQWRGVAT
jgi:hypothetical protein